MTTPLYVVFIERRSISARPEHEPLELLLLIIVLKLKYALQR